MKQSTTIYFSSLFPNIYPQVFQRIKKVFSKYQIEYELVYGTKDIWARDYMPIQISDNKIVHYKYEPDYLKAKYDDSRTLFSDVLNSNKFLQRFNVINSQIILDGGNFVRNSNKVIMADKIFKENSHLTKEEVLVTVKKDFGVDVIIIPKQPYDMFGHSDSMVRWVSESTVLVNDFSLESKSYQKKLIDALELHGLNVIQMKYSKGFLRKGRDWGGYLNFLKVDNILFVPIYFHPEDFNAIHQLKQVYKDCQIVPIQLGEVINEGGALHCISWETINKRCNKWNHI